MAQGAGQFRPYPAHAGRLDVRKLKNLGLTLSLPVGYRLSPRGEAYLTHISSQPVIKALPTGEAPDA